MLLSTRGAVGAGGKNAFDDVRTIQALLNCVPTVQGGPAPGLAGTNLSLPIPNAGIAGGTGISVPV
jgi:hypothetical protein